MTETQQAYNWVAAEPMPAPRADLVRRQDVVHVVDRMIDSYQTQQRSLLDQVQGDSMHGGFLSDAKQVDARRRTSRMYLGYYFGVTAIVSGGLVLLAHGSGYLDANGSFATWLALTGAVALALGWRRHGNELHLTPEAIAQNIVDSQFDLAMHESETRRLSLRWEFDAEQIRQQQQAMAAADARAQAADRMREIEMRRDMQQAQLTRSYVVETPAITKELSIPNDEPTVDEPTVDTWQSDLLRWVGALFDDGKMNDAGIILAKVPWSQRSGWLEVDGANARRVLCEIRPALVVYNGNRWRWRLDLVGSAEQAIDVIAQRF